MGVSALCFDKVYLDSLVMSEIYNSYPKTFTVPDGAVKFKAAVHDKIISDIPINISMGRGELSGTGTSDYLIDGFDMSNFGLYISSTKDIDSLPELKSQFYTKYGSEGYQIVNRKNKTLTLNGFIIATSISDFNVKIANLTLLFATEGLRSVKLKDEDLISCFAKDGFKIENVMVFTNLVAAIFSIELMIV